MTDKEKYETINRLKAKLECTTRLVKGQGDICHPYNCEDCDLCYEQGTLGEQIIDLKRAIEILEKEII